MTELLKPIDHAVKEISMLHSGLGRTLLDSGIRIGELLTEIKGGLKHGEWLPWVEANLPFDIRSAQNYMRVYDNRSKYETLSHLQLTDAYRLLSSGSDKAHVSHNSGDNEWYTPPGFIDAARAAMGSIDCDPASSAIANETVKARKYFTKEDDGLAKKWSGNVWMNPPYAQPLIGQFSEAITAKFNSGEINQAIILVNNATETEWFARMAQTASAICFPSSRVKFLDPSGNATGAPLQGQAVLYFGKGAKKFIKEFSGFGFVLCRP